MIAHQIIPAARRGEFARVPHQAVAVLSARRAPATAWRVFAELASVLGGPHAPSTWRGSIRTAAARWGMHRRSVERGLAWLVEAELVAWAPAPRWKGARDYWVPLISALLESRPALLVDNSKTCHLGGDPTRDPLGPRQNRISSDILAKRPTMVPSVWEERAGKRRRLALSEAVEGIAREIEPGAPLGIRPRGYSNEMIGGIQVELKRRYNADWHAGQVRLSLAEGVRNRGQAAADRDARDRIERVEGDARAAAFLRRQLDAAEQLFAAAAGLVRVPIAVSALRSFVDGARAGLVDGAELECAILAAELPLAAAIAEDSELRAELDRAERRRAAESEERERLGKQATILDIGGKPRARPVSGDTPNCVFGNPAFSSFDAESAAQAMPGKVEAVAESGPPPVLGDDSSDGSARKPPADPSVSVDRSEDRPVELAEHRRPCVERFERVESPIGGRPKRDRPPGARLIGFASTNPHDRAVFAPLDVAPVESDELGSPKRRGPSEQNQCSVAERGGRIADSDDHSGKVERRERRGPSTWRGAEHPASTGESTADELGFDRRRRELGGPASDGDRGEVPRDGRPRRAAVDELDDPRGEVIRLRRPRRSTGERGPQTDRSAIGDPRRSGPPVVDELENAAKRRRVELLAAFKRGELTETELAAAWRDPAETLRTPATINDRLDGLGARRTDGHD